jgi:hypothetical protein
MRLRQYWNRSASDQKHLGTPAYKVIDRDQRFIKEEK